MIYTKFYRNYVPLRQSNSPIQKISQQHPINHQEFIVNGDFNLNDIEYNDIEGYLKIYHYSRDLVLLDFIVHIFVFA